MKNPVMAIIVAIAFISLLSCATAGRGNGLSLQDAIEQSAHIMVGDLFSGTRMAIVAFESESSNLSDFIKEELTGALVRLGIEVADRQNLGFVFQELNFNMTGYVSDENAQRIGHILGAELVITGQLWYLGDVRRLATNAVCVETGIRISAPRFDMRNNRILRNRIAALNRQPITARVARFAVTEHTAPQTAGTYLDRGILFASRSDFQMAIEDFTEAIQLDPNLIGAYILRGRALIASVSHVVSIEDNFDCVIIRRSVGRLATDEQARALNQAIGDFTSAIRLDPNNAGSFRNREPILFSV